MDKGGICFEQIVLEYFWMIDVDTKNDQWIPIHWISKSAISRNHMQTKQPNNKTDKPSMTFLTWFLGSRGARLKSIHYRLETMTFSGKIKSRVSFWHFHKKTFRWHFLSQRYSNQIHKAKNLTFTNLSRQKNGFGS